MKNQNQHIQKTGVISKEETINERGDYWHPDPDKDRKLGGPGPNQRAREDRGVSKSSSSSSSSAKPKLRPGESYMEYSKRMKTQLKKESVEKVDESGMYQSPAPTQKKSLLRFKVLRGEKGINANGT